MKQVTFGFIGSGKISHSSAAALTKHPRATIAAVQDLNKGRADDLADKFDIPKRFTESRDLLATEEIDAVYIAVPNKFHAPLAIEAMKAGKHVILDKPMAMNAAEASEVLSVSRETGRVFTLGMNKRFEEGSQKLRSLVEQGALGEIYYAKAYWFRREGIPKLGTWFGSKAMAGAGAINDIGVHMLDLCLHLMGNFDPVSVYGSTYTKFGNRGLGEGGWGLSEASDITFDVDDLAAAQIKMRNGATVCLETSWAAHQESGSRMGVELFGTEAGAATHPERLFKRDPIDADYRVVENLAAEAALPHCDRFHNFVNHLLGEEPLLVSAEQALSVQKILDAISESSATGASIEIA